MPRQVTGQGHLRLLTRILNTAFGSPPELGVGTGRGNIPRVLRAEHDPGGKRGRSA